MKTIKKQMLLVALCLAVLPLVLVQSAGSAGPPVIPCTNPNNIVSNALVVNGTPCDDVIIGGAASQTINGGYGDDFIDGGSGDDILNGGRGNDVLAGEGGNDTLNGGLGNDILVGGDDTDTCAGGGSPRGGDGDLFAGSCETQTK